MLSGCRYQPHWTDVCHLEEVKKSLTSLQLSIRSLVANSNLQASRIHDDITRLRSLLEVGVAYKLLVTLANIFQSGDQTSLLEGVPLLAELLVQRMVYLHCRATVQQGGRVGAMVQQGGRVGATVQQGGRVGAMVQQGRRVGTMVQRTGGQQGEAKLPISAVNVSQSIRE